MRNTTHENRKSSNMRRQKRRHTVRNTLLVLLFLLGMTGVFLFGFNRWEIVIELNGNDTEYAECEVEYVDPGASAYVTGTILQSVHHDIDLARSGDQINIHSPGRYVLAYTAKFAWLTKTAVRTVIVQDTTPPVITLNHVDDHYTLPHHAYEEEGFSATDTHDGDLTADVKSEERDGIVYYSVRDKAGNLSTAEREIFYDDRNAPEITLASGTDLYFYEGDSFTEDATATDDADGDVTSKIQISGSPDMNKPGTYTITYKVSDEWGNEATATRYVTVKAIPKNDLSDIDESKIIYLTFDDGPGKYTEELLEILDKHEVKATFFVTNGFSDYQDLIGKEYAAGHAIGVHSYTHDYANIYASTEAFWEDFNKMEDIIQEQTGSRTNLFRFPGGSSNTVSANYSSGIMTELTKEASEKNYIYVDWNVSSGDAGNTTDSDVIYDNMISGIHRTEKSFILCHDIKSFTVNMIDRFITTALEEGYTFLPITEDSPECHHRVNN